MDDSATDCLIEILSIDIVEKQNLIQQLFIELDALIIERDGLQKTRQMYDAVKLSHLRVVK